LLDAILRRVQAVHEVLECLVVGLDLDHQVAQELSKRFAGIG